MTSSERTKLLYTNNSDYSSTNSFRSIQTQDYSYKEQGITDKDPLLLNGIADGDAADSSIRNSSFAGASFNMMTAIMGSGILGLAYAMRHSGIIPFTLLMIFMAVCSIYAIHLLLKLCTLTGINTYEGLGVKAFGKAGKIAVSVSILIQNIGATTSYMVIAGDLLPDLMRVYTGEDNDTETPIYVDRTFLLCLVAGVVVFPLTSLRRIGFLAYTSTVSVLFMTLFTVMVIVKKWTTSCPLPVNDNSTLSTLDFSSSSSSSSSSPFPSFASNIVALDSNRTDSSSCTAQLVSLTTDFFFVLPTMAFSFVCHTALLPIYAELKKPSQQRMQSVANFAVSTCFTLYFAAGLFGYLTFYDAVDSDLLKSYSFERTDTLVCVVRTAFVIAVILTAPGVCFPARKTILLLLFPNTPFSWFLHYSLTIFLVGLTLVLALFVPDIKNVFGLAGATSSVSLMFILPALFYLKIAEGSYKSKSKLPAVIMVVLGVVIGVGCVGGVIASWLV